ncbi:MAG: hypothetical protein GX275_03625 [Clostridiales bacterium]|nr:hypothetical protein [Clostridiales bacterium]
MLIYEEYRNFLKKIMEDDKSSKLFSNETIQYNNEEELFNNIKNGYIAMGSINLQDANNGINELIEMKEYETWLSGE